MHTSNHDFIIGKEINGFFFVLVLFFEMVLLCSPDRLGVFRDLLVSASPMLELRVYTTTPGLSTNILIGLSRWLRGIKVCATSPDDLSSIPGTHVVEEKNQFLKFVRCGTCIPTHIHVCAQNNK